MSKETPQFGGLKILRGVTGEEGRMNCLDTVSLRCVGDIPRAEAGSWLYRSELEILI